MSDFVRFQSSDCVYVISSLNKRNADYFSFLPSIIYNVMIRLLPYVSTRFCHVYKLLLRGTVLSLSPCPALYCPSTFARYSIYAIARICHGNSVRPSVCLSVTLVCCIKTAESIIEILSPSNRPIIQFCFRHGVLLCKSDGFTSNCGAEYKEVAIFEQYTAIYIYIYIYLSLRNGKR